MTTRPLAMSGLHSLDENQLNLLAAMGLEVPSLMTTAQLTALLEQAESRTQEHFHPVFSKCTREVLAAIKLEHAL